jgi:NAD(P)H-hydrate epimerase
LILLKNQNFVKGIQTQIFRFDHEDSEKLFPPSAIKDIHKGDRGHLWVCAGSPGFWGAGIMASKAAIRCGAGYCTLISAHSEVHQIPMFHPELLTAVLDNPNLFWKSIKEPSAIVLGPGFGVSKKLESLLEYLLVKATAIPVIIDADALTVLSRLTESDSFELPEKWILTPHEGELARLLKLPVEKIHANREASIFAAYQKYNCTILLKGHHSLIISDIGKIFMINEGNPVLAKAGTGDVLAGMIGGLLAQGAKSNEACLLGTYWHAAFGDWYVKEIGVEFSLRASEISDLLPLFWKEKYALYMEA